MNTSLMPATVLFCFFAIASCSSDSDGVMENVDNTGSDTTQGQDSGSEDNTGGDGPAEQAIEASYRVTFNASWSENTHPINFPSAPHFSGLVGAVHSEQAILWQPGQIASDGIEQMAESGAKNLLLAEIQATISEGRALTELSGGGVGVSPGSVAVEFSVTRDNPQVSLVSMVAPSPDWFVGVHGLSLLDNDGQFRQSLSVDLAVYDAGTDSGLIYTSANQDTQPRQPVALLSSDSADSDFTNGLPIVGQFVFEKL